MTDKERKMLWAKAGNRCSFRYEGDLCDRELVKMDGDTQILNGEECHIIDKKGKTSRYVKEYPNRESEENYILLCRDHHATIDSNGDKYTVDILKVMKKQHEDNIAAKVKEGEIQFIEINDFHLDLKSKDSDELIGMEVNQPAKLSDVRLKLETENVRKVVGFTTNQGIAVIMKNCINCKTLIRHVGTGRPPAFLECNNCGYKN